MLLQPSQAETRASKVRYIHQHLQIFYLGKTRSKLPLSYLSQLVYCEWFRRSSTTEMVLPDVKLVSLAHCRTRNLAASALVWDLWDMRSSTRRH
jgi:hypothetical protein